MQHFNLPYNVSDWRESDLGIDLLGSKSLHKAAHLLLSSNSRWGRTLLVLRRQSRGLILRDSHVHGLNGPNLVRCINI
jgi:hypothetical protein